MWQPNSVLTNQVGLFHTIGKYFPSIVTCTHDCSPKRQSGSTANVHGAGAGLFIATSHITLANKVT
jgi:hypothetical protein